MPLSVISSPPPRSTCTLRIWPRTVASAPLAGSAGTLKSSSPMTRRRFSPRTICVPLLRAAAKRPSAASDERSAWATPSIDSRAFSWAARNSVGERRVAVRPIARAARPTPAMTGGIAAAPATAPGLETSPPSISWPSASPPAESGPLRNGFADASPGIMRAKNAEARLAASASPAWASGVSMRAPAAPRRPVISIPGVPDVGTTARASPWRNDGEGDSPSGAHSFGFHGTPSGPSITTEGSCRERSFTVGIRAPRA